MSTTSTFIDQLDSALSAYLTNEQERLENERDFLLHVLAGRTDGVTVEDVSTDATKTFLSGALGQYFPITDDTSGSG